MISGEDIAKYISNPAAISAFHVLELEKLLIKHPYSSSLHLLYLKGLALHNHLNFEEKLKSTAIHSADRAHLYHLIHSGEDDVNQNETPIVENTSTNLQEKEPETIIEATRVKELVIQPNEQTDELTSQEPSENFIQENEKTEDELEQQNEAHLSIEQTVVPEEKNFDDLDVDIINAAIDQAYFEEHQISEEDEADAEEKIDTHVSTEPSPDNETGLADKNSTKTNEKEISTENLSFTAWLKYKQNNPTASAEPSEKELKTAPSHEKASEEPQKNKKTKSEIDALLDKFMKEEPRISKPIKEFYNPVDHAKKSIEETDNLVTETLAKIHVMQKNYSKAITAYEKLILLYPEKKTFFASQIEKIREEIKNK